MTPDTSVLQAHTPYQSGTWTKTMVKWSRTTESVTWTMAASTSQPRYPLTHWRSLFNITHVCIQHIEGTDWHHWLPLGSPFGSFQICLRYLTGSQAMQMACAQSWWSRASRGHRRSLGGRMSGRSPASPWNCNAGSEQDSLEKSGWVSGTEGMRGSYGLCERTWR